MHNEQKIYLSGIGGIGMSALAQLLQERGDSVSGSDRAESPVTEMLMKKGIQVVIGQSVENIPKDADLLVFSAALAEDHVDRVRARELGIPELSYFEMLGEVSIGKRTVAVAGTHGKTTTTGMLAKILIDAGASPTVVVGSLVQDFGSNYVSGASDIFVVEACEYQRHFLNLSPEVLVITNLEFDHTDYFKDLGDVQDAFRSLIVKVPRTGTVVTDVSHPNIAPLLTGTVARIVDYRSEPAYETKLLGEFNVDNARAAAAAARAVSPGLSEQTLAQSLASFSGTWRRFEYKGKTKRGADVYDDYAHHPTAVAKTLAELKKKIPETSSRGKVYVAFHPHLYSRTRDLFEGFAHAFTDADKVLVAPIYAAREVDDGTVSNVTLAEAITKNGVEATAGDFTEIRTYFETEPGEGDVVITMGAGDIYKVADVLVAH